MTQSAPNSNASNHQWAGARWKIRRPFQKWRGEPTQNAPKKNRRPKQKKISTENTFANRSHRHGNPCIWRLPFDKDILPSTFLFPPHQLLLISGHSAGLFADWWKEKSFFFFLHRPKSQSAQTNYDDCRQGTPKSLRHFSLFDAKQKNALFLMKIAAIMYEIPTNSMKSPPKETLTIWPFTDVTIIFDKRINSEKFNLNRIKNYF